jgi:predicted phage replisome organizer
VGDVKWIRLSVDMFNNRKIKHLRSQKDGDKKALIWVELLTVAGRCNSGGMIFLTWNIPYTTKMLADELGYKENTMISAIKSFKELGMVQEFNGALSITNWEEYQNIDGLEKIREQTRNRVAKHRQKQNVLPSNVTVTPEVTQSNAIDIELELDKEKDKEESKEKDVANPVPVSATFPPNGFEMLCVDKLIKSVVSQFNGAKVPATTAARVKWCEHIEKMKRLDHRTEAEIQEALNFAITDQFWKTNIRSTKTLREKFETLIMQARKPRGTGAVKSKPNQFQNFPQREIDYDALVLQQLQGG